MKKMLYILGLIGFAFQGMLALCDNRMTRPLIIDTLCTLSQCCLQTEQQFIETFTALQELENTVTTCCDDILISLSNLAITCTLVLEGTFTTLEDIKNTLTVCCTSFESTLTEIISFLSSLTSVSCPCSPTPITSAGTIAVAGVYCLANDIVGQIAIASNDVVLDLNDHEISGGTNGIVVGSGIQNVVIRQGSIASVANNGVLVQDGCSNIALTNLDFIGTGSYAIALEGIVGSPITHCTISEIATHSCDAGIRLFLANNTVVQSSSFFDCLSTVRSVINMTSDLTSGNQWINCTVKQCAAPYVISATDQANLYIDGVDIVTCNSILQLSNCPQLVVKNLLVQDTSFVAGNHGITCTQCANFIMKNVQIEAITLADDTEGISISNSSNCSINNVVLSNITNSSTTTSLLINLGNSSGSLINKCSIHDLTQTVLPTNFNVLLLNSSANSSLTDVAISSVTITGGAAGACIGIQNSAGVILGHCQLQSLNNVQQAINVTDSLNAKLNAINISKSAGSFQQAILMDTSSNSILENITIVDGIWNTAVQAQVIQCIDSLSMLLQQIIINNIQNTVGDVSGIKFTSSAGILQSNSIIDNAYIFNMQGSATTIGIDMDRSAEVIIQHCLCSDINPGGSGYSFIGSTQCSVGDCIANNCLIGFVIDDSIGTQFIDIGNNIAFSCSGTGFFFVLPSGTNKIYNNYAAKSPTNYSGGVPNVQLLAAAGPVVGSNIDGQ